MSKEIRRLRRRRTISDDTVDNLSSSKFDIAESETQNELESDQYNKPALTIIGAIVTQISNIDSIRYELREDSYHSSLDESDYSNDTHDWDGDNQSVSTDYWHFLGCYE